MNITYACPHCGHGTRSEVEVGENTIPCSHCTHRVRIPTGAVDGDRLHRCLVCPSTDLFVRKDFPQRLGVGVVALGIVGSSIAWAYSLPVATFAVLFATALIDVALYWIVPDALMCYSCGAEYRHAGGMTQHGAFDLETHERYRQQAARLAGR